ncbi:4-Cys prefix domain-containing protein [Halotia branconii]|uniref:Serine/threonine protein kinase n=1 Tax=Halotia branconii CENA392 TaxID=1539056 RepID=A0AAJ6NN46_9CYAN|nr:4-Cys prefix domain-containing protein [Halotia branconii]WGV23575.1 serine/threonine protein kinase [Halotia branconii CENA392]
MCLCINPACPQPYYSENDKDRFCKSCGSQLELLGRYRVIRLLSDKTGFGKVYEIHEHSTSKILKVLHEDLSNDAKAVELFRQQADVPQIDSYFQYRTRNGLVLHCIAMAKIDSFDSEQWLQKRRSHPTAQETAQQQSQIKQISQTKLHTSLPPSAKQSKEVPLTALFAAMLVSLGLLNAIAFATGYPKFVALPSQGQFPQRKGKIDYFPYEEGRDNQGRIAKFNIAVLSVEYKWLVGSNFQIKYNDQVISLEVLKLNLEQEGIQKIMKNPSEIISVGMASCEGNVEVEQRRAFERSKQIQVLAKKLFSNTPSVKGYRLLNLGRFQRSNCQTNQEATAYQRSVILIGVKKQSANVILDEALRDRLENKPFGDFKLRDYSLGSADKFRTIISNLSEK